MVNAEFVITLVYTDDLFHSSQRFEKMINALDLLVDVKILLPDTQPNGCLSGRFGLVSKENQVAVWILGNVVEDGPEPIYSVKTMAYV